MTQPTDWLAVKAWAQQRIETLRDELEAGLDAVPTAAKRGQIMALRELLERGDPPKRPEISERITVGMTAGPPTY